MFTIISGMKNNVQYPPIELFYLGKATIIKENEDKSMNEPANLSKFDEFGGLCVFSNGILQVLVQAANDVKCYQLANNQFHTYVPPMLNKFKNAIILSFRKGKKVKYVYTITKEKNQCTLAHQVSANNVRYRISIFAKIVNFESV